ncbi:hypothetical protein X801_08072, partial [Opisthorchis viverrini]
RLLRFLRAIRDHRQRGTHPSRRLSVGHHRRHISSFGSESDRHSYGRAWCGLHCAQYACAHGFVAYRSKRIVTGQLGRDHRDRCGVLRPYCACVHCEPRTDPTGTCQKRVDRHGKF